MTWLIISLFFRGEPFRLLPVSPPQQSSQFQAFPAVWRQVAVQDFGHPAVAQTPLGAKPAQGTAYPDNLGPYQIFHSITQLIKVA